MAAYAIAITEDNLRGVILSEAGRNFDLKAALQWFDEYGEGWFLRDPESGFDCAFFMPDVFEEIYMFVSGNNDKSSLIRTVIRI